MQNNTYEGKHPRGSSPNQEKRQELSSWAKGIRSLEEVTEKLFIPRLIEQCEDQRMAVTVRQSGDERRWRDVGGEGG